MINLGNITNENNKKTQWKMAIYTWSCIQNLVTGGSGSGKTNTLLNLINEPNDIDKMYLYASDLKEPKYKVLIKNVKKQE